MSAKGFLTPLDDAGLLAEPEIRRLRAVGITTVEELAGQLATGHEGGLRELLGIDQERAVELRSEAIAALPVETREAFADSHSFNPSFGAWRPEK